MKLRWFLMNLLMDLMVFGESAIGVDGLGERGDGVDESGDGLMVLGKSAD